MKGLIDIQLLDNEIGINENYDESDTLATALRLVRNSMCSQGELFSMVLDVIRLSTEGADSTKSTYSIFNNYLKKFFPTQYYTTPINVYSIKEKSWLPCLGKFVDCYVLVYGEDIIIEVKKNVLEYNNYIKKFTKK